MPLTIRSTTGRRGRSYWLGLLASVALLAGLLVPTSTASADITFGKPTSVDAKSISGSNGLKVTWKAPTGGTPAAYKVTWGTSSSSSKASYATYTTGTSATLSATGMTTSTYYYVWVQPWSAASSSGEATGTISSSDRAKTSSFAYKAPAVVKVANMTKTTAEITWRTVTGSPGYVVRAYNYTTGSYKYQIGFDGSTIFTGLTPGTQYKFTVANRLLISGYDTVPGVRMSGFSSAYAKASTNPTSVTLADGTGPIPMRDAPTDLAFTDRDSSSVTLTWTPPPGYDAATDKFRVYWAENQEMTDNDGYTVTNLTGTGGKVTGLDANTNYYLRIRMVRVTTDAQGVAKATAVSDRSTAIMAKTRSPKGFISGKITGVSSGVMTDYQAVAFRTSGTTPGEINAVSDVTSSGTYKLELRPGTYFVKLAYVGTGNYASEWLTADGSAAYSSQDAGTTTVELDKTTSVASLAVGQGATITGKVTSSSTGNAIRDVYVSARTAWSTAREVVGQATTDSSGNYTIQGLPPGTTVYVRVADAARRHTSKTVTPASSTPAAGASSTVNITMTPA